MTIIWYFLKGCFGKWHTIDLVFQLPQPSSDQTPDLAEIQTRYLRCMIGLDADTSGLEQVSCSACCSNNLHAPHKCQILRERMHLLLLHISNSEKVLEPSSKVNVLCETTSVDLHQSIVTHESLKFCSMNKLLATNPQTPLYSSTSPSRADPEAAMPTISQTPLLISSGTLKNSVFDSSKTVNSSNNEVDMASARGSPRERSFITDACSNGLKGGKMRATLLKPTSSNIVLRNKIGGTVVPVKSDSKTLPNSTGPAQNKQSCRPPNSKRIKNAKKSAANMKLRELFKMLESGDLQVQCPSNHSIEQMTTLEELEKQIMSHPENDSKVNFSDCQTDNTNFPSREEKFQQTMSRCETSSQSVNKYKRNPRLHDNRDTISSQLSRHQCLPSYLNKSGRLYVASKPGTSALTPDSSGCIKVNNRSRFPSHFVQSRCVSPSSIRIHPLRKSNFTKHHDTNSQYRGIVCRHPKSFYDLKNLQCAPFVNVNYNIGREFSFFRPFHRVGAFHSPGWSCGKSSNPARRLNPYSTPYPSVAMIQSDICDRYLRQSKFNHGYRLPHSLWGDRFNALW